MMSRVVAKGENNNNRREITILEVVPDRFKVVDEVELCLIGG